MGQVIRERERKSVGIASITDKTRKDRPRWFDHEERRFGNSINSYGIERGWKKSKGKM